MQPPRVPPPFISPSDEVTRAYRSGTEPIIYSDVRRNPVQSPNAEIGSTGLKRWGGRIYQEFLPELRGVRGVRVYDEMRRSDPVIGAVFSAIKAAVRSVSWKGEAADESEPSKKWATFLEQCMDDMECSWGDFISDVLTMVPFGWSLFEQVYKVRAGEGADQPSDFNDGLIGWANLAFRYQESLYLWDIDNNGRILGMVQMPPPDYTQRYLPIAKCVLFRTDHEANNPEGLSMLRNVYRPWYYKKNLEEVEAIGTERDFTGTLVLKLPTNASDQDHVMARGILEKAKSDEMNGMKFQKGPDPNGRDDWEVDLLHSPGSRSIDVDKSISRYASEIATVFLAQFLQLGQGGQRSGGSYALSRSHKDFFFLAIQAIVDEIAETAQSWMVTPLMRLNGVPVENRPTLSHGRIAPREIDSLINAIDLMARDGLLGPVDDTLVNFLRTEMDIPPAEGSAVNEWISERERMQNAQEPQSPSGSPSSATVSR